MIVSYMKREFGLMVGSLPQYHALNLQEGLGVDQCHVARLLLSLLINGMHSIEWIFWAKSKQQCHVLV